MVVPRIFNVIGGRCPPFRFHSGYRAVSDAIPSWVEWEKTRWEIFGHGKDAWEDGWAFHLIFGHEADKKQFYLWQFLAHGWHYQHGQGILRIPGEWKKDDAQSGENV